MFATYLYLYFIRMLSFDFSRQQIVQAFQMVNTSDKMAGWLLLPSANSHSTTVLRLKVISLKIKIRHFDLKFCPLKDGNFISSK